MKTSALSIRLVRFLLLLAVSCVVMTFTHVMGQIVGGSLCGGSLESFELLPWHLPFSYFRPDPYPLVTLWAGLIIGVLAPVGVAMLLRQDWMWLIANFCILANGIYIAFAWFLGMRELDTPKMLALGASPLAIAGYCLLTIGYGYFAFRHSCIRAFTGREKQVAAEPEIED